MLNDPICEHHRNRAGARKKKSIEKRGRFGVLSNQANLGGWQYLCNLLCQSTSAPYPSGLASYRCTTPAQCPASFLALRSAPY
jgi:hypothetical protein